MWKQMSGWFEVFDNEEVQLSTRRKVMALSVIVMVAACVTIICVAATLSGQITAGAGFLTISATWCGAVFWLATRLRRLRRVAWCLKISDDAVVAYDYARRKTVIPWSAVTRIDWTDHSLLIAGQAPCAIEIPELFTDFAALSHSVYERSERSDVPVFVDGQPLPVLDVYQLYPFLRELSIVPDDPGSGGLATR